MFSTSASTSSTSGSTSGSTSSSPSSRHSTAQLLSILSLALVASVLLATVFDDASPSLDPSSSLDPSASVLSRLLSSSTLHSHHHRDIFEETHKPLFPLSTRDYLGLLCSVGGLLVAAGGGIGGGGILVPIYALVLGFSPKQAIPLSNVTVFGGAMANCLLNLPKRHPNPKVDRPLIDWDLVLVMEPLTIAGALIGAVLNKVLPDTILAVLLVVLLSLTAKESLTKAKKMYAKESAEIRRRANTEKSGARAKESEMIRKAQASVDAVVATNPVGVGDEEDESSEEEDVEASAGSSLLSPEEQKTNARNDPRSFDAELQSILEEERVTPMGKLLSLVTLFVIVLVINILKGGGSFSPIGIKCGSPGFWTANFSMIFFIVLFAHYVRQYLVKRYEVKERVNYLYVEGDIKWSARNTVVYPAICAFAGFFAGLFGVGGGIVKGPLMLAMNVHPAVSASCSATMILFTSFTATTSFVVFGLLVQDYAVVCVVVGFVSTYIGQLTLAIMMKKNDRNSYIAFSIGGVVALSAMLMGFQAMISVATEHEEHHSGGFCGTDS